MAYNGIEPAEMKLLPTRLRIGLDEYRRNRRPPRDLSCLFGSICLWRMVYQAVEPKIPGLFPLEQALGIFGVGREASVWAAKMRKVLKEKTNGVNRVLHSMGALRQRRGLTGSEKDFQQAVNYLRRFLPYFASGKAPSL